jgi:SAM-dependent methyltransferase
LTSTGRRSYRTPRKSPRLSPTGEEADARRVQSTNLGDHPDVYELENAALDPDGHVLSAMREMADWRSGTILDLGCGTGFWLPVYAADAARVLGVEPDPALLGLASRRVAGESTVEVLTGSAEHLPLPTSSVDVVHARFAYFFPPGVDAGLVESLRVLRPGGTLVVVDNDHEWGEFAELLRLSPTWAPDYARVADTWWRERGATRRNVHSSWLFPTAVELERVLRIEFGADVVDTWLASRPGATGLTYGYTLFGLRKSSP